MLGQGFVPVVHTKPFLICDSLDHGLYLHLPLPAFPGKVVLIRPPQDHNARLDSLKP